MLANELQDYLMRNPFKPFRVVTSSGEAYDVRRPFGAALMKNRLFVALPDDRWILVPFLQISSIESLPTN